jgi:hypothetical protein
MSGCWRCPVGHVLQDEELLGVDLATPHEVRIDMAKVAGPYLEARHRQHPGLKGQVFQVNALQTGRGFDLDDVPGVVQRRAQDVHPAVSAVGGERRLEHWVAEFDGLLGEPDGFVEIEDAITDLDPVEEHLLGQCADLVALVEDRLCGGVGFWDQVFGVIGVPEQFVTLEARQEFALGDEWPSRRVT